MAGMFILAVLVLGAVELVTAQIPSVCANNANLTSGVCCPDNCGGSTRGECVQVSTMCKTDYSSTGLPTCFIDDGRFNWPSQIFTQICQCKDNYDGYNCSDCKFGYGPRGDCSIKTERVRKAITDSDFNWTQYHEQLNRSKTEIQSRYKVYTGGNLQDETNYKEVSVFNLFAWTHHYVARTQIDYGQSGSAWDYAHESVGFLTWHRIYLLWFEREMRILLDDEDFTLRYWDWTLEENRAVLFTPDKLGEPDTNGQLTGDLMSSWYVVCVDQAGNTIKNIVCDPTTTGNVSVVRCHPTNSHCSLPDWPTEEYLNETFMKFRKYRLDTKRPNKYDKMSFSNHIEGFAVEEECDAIDTQNEEILCGKREPYGLIRRRIHNLVHVLLGGTMGDVPIAANDPVFINHHTMIDCLFEQWLTSDKSVKNYPSTLDPQFAGHAAGDCIVPFIPVYKHGDVFNKNATDFGYSCDLRSFNSGVRAVSSLAMLVSMIVVYLATITV